MDQCLYVSILYLNLFFYIPGLLLEFHEKKKIFIKACHDYYNNSCAGNTLEPINPVSNRSLKSGRINKMAVLKGFHRQENGWLSFSLGQNIVAVITR